MRICFFTKHEITWGSSRERIGVYLDFLKSRGHICDVISCIPNKLSRIWLSGKTRRSIFAKLYSFWQARIIKNLKFIYLIIMARKYDVIVIQKVNISYPFLAILRSRNKNIIFDFDDLCFKLKEKSPMRILKLYKHIIAGNSHLAGIAIAARGNDSVTVIPTGIDCNLYAFKKRDVLNSPLIIGWAGSGENHFRHLEILVSPLKELAKQIKFNFKLVGAMGSEKIIGLFRFLNSKFICIDWIDNYRELPQVIQTFDIGVMPLRDDNEARGKCAFKILQYMACQVCVVASPVGTNKDIIEDGMNGFLAKDTAEWIKKLTLLVRDHKLRDNLGKSGRKTVEEQYSFTRTQRAFIDVIEWSR